MRYTGPAGYPSECGIIVPPPGVVLFVVNRTTVRNAPVRANIQAILEGVRAAPFEGLIRTDEAAGVDLRAGQLTSVELVAATRHGVRG